jgi:tetratricopeptide (TPR) repeat protein
MRRGSGFRKEFFMCDDLRIRARTAAFFLLFVLFQMPPVHGHGDVHEQIELVTRQIELSPDNPQLYLKRSELHREHEDYDAAVADCLRALELDSKLDAARLLMARAFLEGDWPLASGTAINQYLIRFPEHAGAWEIRARAWLLLDEPLFAADAYLQAIRHSKTDQPAYFLERSRALLKGGKDYSIEALASLDEGIRRLGPLVVLQLEAIELEMLRGHFDKALQRLETIAVQAGRQESWLLRKGEILLRAQRREEARAAFEEAQQALLKLPPTRRSTPATRELEEKIEAHLASFSDSNSPPILTPHSQ